MGLRAERKFTFAGYGPLDGRHPVLRRLPSLPESSKRDSRIRRLFFPRRDDGLSLLSIWAIYASWPGCRAQRCHGGTISTEADQLVRIIGRCYVMLGPVYNLLPLVC